MNRPGGSGPLLTPDICVIGAGSGGLSVAAAAAAFGVPVVLVERGLMGGDCLNFGCVPSKALIAAARRAETFRASEAFGIAPREPDVDFAAVHRHVRDIIDGIAPTDSEERFTGLGVTVIKAEARFLDADTLLAGDSRIRARRFVIATGSSPAVPPIAGLDAVPFLTNETIFDLTERPGHLLIIGGGAIGLELAQAHRRLGSAVTVLEAGTVLGREDPELAETVVRSLRREGVTILDHAKIERVDQTPNQTGDRQIEATVETPQGPQIVSGTHLLVATGRTPNIADLGLEAAGIRHDRKGITVDRRLQTSNRRVLAIGDVAGGQFTHTASYHAGIAVRRLLFRLPASIDPSILPHAIYTDPELAQIGLSEVEARSAGHRVTVLKWPYAENDRARADRKTDGLIKIVAGRGGRILGVGIVGAGAGEMINLYALAVARRMKVRDLATFVAPYPTVGEIGKRAAMTYFSGATRNSLVRAAIGFLRRFG